MNPKGEPFTVTYTYVIVEIKQEGAIRYKIEQEHSYKTMFTRKIKTYRTTPEWRLMCGWFCSVEYAKAAIKEIEILLLSRKDDYKKDVEKVTFTI